MENKQKKGISLIVLVITIIVMIILAAAIILSLNGSGIINKANEAKTKSDIANAKHVVSLAKAEWDLMSKSEKQSIIGGFKSYAENKLEDAGFKTGAGTNSNFVTETGKLMSSGQNTIYIGSDDRVAIIPEGFTASTNTAEDTVTEGLVIKDEVGNEFVWVPVDDFSKFERTTTYKPNEDITDPGSDYIEPYVTNNYKAERIEYNLMRESVQTNGGFYIGRYEAGTTTERKKDTDNNTTDLLVQKNNFTYNMVCWGQSMTDTEGEVTDIVYEKNQGIGAVELSRNMYKDSSSVVSTLCYGVQWDAALRFVASNKEYESFPINSSGKGNHAGSLKETGCYATNNIYDLAGNLSEWTMEISEYNEIKRVVRGSRYYTANFNRNSAFTRYVFVSDSAYDYLGFRVTLYIK